MQIILMRHGEAVPFAPTDAERALTPRGRGEATATANRLATAGFIPQAVMSSTRIRAAQTAELVAAVLCPAQSISAIAGITPEDPWMEAMARLEASVTDGALVVFHQPILMHIVASLVTGDPNGRVDPGAATATAYVLSLEGWLPGCARLVAAYQP